MLIDTHAHINMLKDPELGIIEAREAGVKEIIIPSASEDDFENILELCDRYADIYIPYRHRDGGYHASKTEYPFPCPNLLLLPQLRMHRAPNLIWVQLQEAQRHRKAEVMLREGRQTLRYQRTPLLSVYTSDRQDRYPPMHAQAFF